MMCSQSKRFVPFNLVSISFARQSTYYPKQQCEHFKVDQFRPIDITKIPLALVVAPDKTTVNNKTLE